MPATRVRTRAPAAPRSWPIPVEQPLVDAVRRGTGAGRRGRPFETVTGADGGRLSILATTGDGACVFFEPRAGRLCAVHRTVGPRLLPSACRNFPRIALRDPRGVFVTLSHYCPTAARLLLLDRDLAIVDAPRVAHPRRRRRRPGRDRRAAAAAAPGHAHEPRCVRHVGTGSRRDVERSAAAAAGAVDGDLGGDGGVQLNGGREEATCPPQSRTRSPTLAVPPATTARVPACDHRDQELPRRACVRELGRVPAGRPRRCSRGGPRPR